MQALEATGHPGSARLKQPLLCRKMTEKGENLDRHVASGLVDDEESSVC